MNPRPSALPRAARVFDRRAGEYDAWFEDSLLYQVELAALEEAAAGLDGPGLEVGVGPGRFARDLGTDFGLDPAPAPLNLAARRGVTVFQGLAEALPLRDACLGRALLLFTLCFLQEPGQALAEIRRVLRPGGCLLLGLIPADSPWGRMLADRGRKGHAFYRHARFVESAAALDLMREAGLEPDLQRCRSTLMQEPELFQAMETPRPGLIPGAGFQVLAARRPPRHGP